MYLYPHTDWFQMIFTPYCSYFTIAKHEKSYNHACASSVGWVNTQRPHSSTHVCACHLHCPERSYEWVCVCVCASDREKRQNYRFSMKYTILSFAISIVFMRATPVDLHCHRHCVSVTTLCVDVLWRSPQRWIANNVAVVVDARTVYYKTETRKKKNY